MPTDDNDRHFTTRPIADLLPSPQRQIDEFFLDELADKLGISRAEIRELILVMYRIFHGYPS